MKRFIAVLLVLSALFLVGSCAKDSSEPSATTTANSTPAADDTSVDQTPSSGKDTTTHVGYWDDPVDHHARETYNIIYYSYSSDASIDRWYEAMVKCEEYLNVKVDFQTANSDSERFNNNIELLANKYDGMIVAHDKPSEVSAFEILSGIDTPWISFSTPFLDEDMHANWPCVTLDGYAAGRLTTQWLIDNYKDYWGEIDTSKLGYVTVTLSTLDLFYPRSDASEELFNATFPEGLYIEGDVPMGQAFTAESAYNMISAYVSAHPEIEYWWFNSVAMMFAPGVARAIETLGISDKALITCCESNTAVTEWDSGYTGSWVSAAGIAEPLFACPALAGIVALIDGRATPETLWADTKREPYGDDYAIYPLEIGMITQQDYKDYFAAVDARYFG